MPVRKPIMQSSPAPPPQQETGYVSRNTWRPGKISLEWIWDIGTENEREKDVVRDARILSHLAVYLESEGVGAGLWCVGHIATKLCMLRMKTEGDAVRYADEVLGELGNALRATTKEKLLAAFSPKLLAWSKKCWEAQTWIDP